MELNVQLLSIIKFAHLTILKIADSSNNLSQELFQTMYQIRIRSNGHRILAQIPGLQEVLLGLLQHFRTAIVQFLRPNQIQDTHIRHDHTYLC